MSRRGWALFAVMGVIWGLPYLLIKIADGGVSVPVLVFARVATGTLLLLPVALHGGRLRALRPYLKWLVAFAAVEVILPWLLLSTAEQHLSSSLSGLLLAAVPVIGVGVARLAGDREPLSERGAQEGPGQFGETLGAGGAQCLPWGVGQPVGAPFDLIAAVPAALGGVAVGINPPAGREPVPRRGPFGCGPAPAGEHLLWCGADGGEGHQRLARVQADRQQRRDVPVPAMLTQQVDGVPQNQVRLARPGQIRARGRQCAPGGPCRQRRPSPGPGLAGTLGPGYC